MDLEDFEGKRVLVIASVNGNTKKAVIVGRGALAGVFYPDDAVGPIATKIREEGGTNPKIDLDDGGHAWGCEVWWMSEQKADMWLHELQSNGYELEYVTMDEVRKQYRALKGGSK